MNRKFTKIESRKCVCYVIMCINIMHKGPVFMILYKKHIYSTTLLIFALLLLLDNDCLKMAESTLENETIEYMIKIIEDDCQVNFD